MLAEVDLRVVGDVDVHLVLQVPGDTLGSVAQVDGRVVHRGVAQLCQLGRDFRGLVGEQGRVQPFGEDAVLPVCDDDLVHDFEGFGDVVQLSAVLRCGVLESLEPGLVDVRIGVSDSVLQVEGQVVDQVVVGVVGGALQQCQLEPGRVLEAGGPGGILQGHIAGFDLVLEPLAVIGQGLVREPFGVFVEEPVEEFGGYVALSGGVGDGLKVGVER